MAIELNYLDILESGEKYKTKGKNERIIYPLKNFKNIIQYQRS